LIMQSDDVDSIFFKHHSIEYELAWLIIVCKHTFNRSEKFHAD
jgi:hypothetical protein